jgi:hypothetical protein
MRKVAVKKALSQNLEAYELGPRERALPQRCACAFARELHFVGEHEDMTHDGRFLFL